MQIIDLEKFASNWKLAKIDPVKKDLIPFLLERSEAIKKINSNRFSNQEQLQKAMKEEKFINAITALDEAYEEFVNHVEEKLNKVIIQYAKSINEFSTLESENSFLRESLKSLSKREEQLIEILSTWNKKV